MAKEIAANPQKDCFYEKGTFLASARLLGLLSDELSTWANAPTVDLFVWENKFITTRKTAMKTKDFGELDALKTHLANAGVIVRMSKEGVTLIAGPNVDSAKLEALK